MSKLKNLTATALCIALGLVMPIIFHAIGLGAAFTPMHLPVYVCGLSFGPFWGMLCGLITPVVSSLTTGMPPLYPTCITMTAELAVYGLFSGLLYRELKLNVYLSIVLTMIAGKIVAGIITAILIGFQNYTFSAFLSSYFMTAIPGILLILIFVPPVVFALKRGRIITDPKRER